MAEVNLLRRSRAKQLRRRLEILRQTHRWKPDHIALAASGARIYVDVSDRRGWEIVRGLGRGHQPALIDLWRRAIQELQPQVVVDVGSNYGEMLLSASYPPGARVLAIEANPSIAAYLRRSVAEHPDRDLIELHEVLASDLGGTERLWVDPGWSGSASAAGLPGTESNVEVRAQRLDALVNTSGQRIVMKVDAEGWEGKVLGGATGITTRAESFVGLVEFDPGHLRRAGSEPGEVFEMLRVLGDCWSVSRQGALIPALQPPEGASDLLVVSDTATAKSLGAGDPTTT